LLAPDQSAARTRATRQPGGSLRTETTGSPIEHNPVIAKRFNARRGTAALAAAVALAVSASVLWSTTGATASATSRARSPTVRIEGPLGHGASEVWLVVDSNVPLRSVVVFGHGWKTTPSSPGHPWVYEFLPWLDHLVANGNAVIFPAYQLTATDPADVARVQAFRTAITTGYVRLGRPKVPFVAFGYSFGASLAFYYAANARAWGVPVPRAVQATFPAGMIAGAPLPGLVPSIRVLIQVGDADTQAGTGGANEFWRWLASHPPARRQFEVIRSTPQLLADHAAPHTYSPAARRAFWLPLDRLIALARRA
jgi:hypothetical protein